MTEMKAHYLVDIYGCTPAAGDADYWPKRTRMLCEAFGLTIVREVVHPFSPHGMTLLYVLAESHLALHTWPEERFVALELFTCRQLPDYELKLRDFLDDIPLTSAKVTVVLRGDAGSRRSLTSLTITAASLPRVVDAGLDMRDTVEQAEVEP